MRLVRVCPKCGHEHPSRLNARKCIMCKEYLSHLWCFYGQHYVEKDLMTWSKKGEPYNYCKKCNSLKRMAADKKNPEARKKRQNAFVDRLRSKYDVLRDQLLELNEKTFKPMTEDEWHAICNHFGGCALCGEEHIESRQFFINYKHGGKYSKWNMFPLCSKCTRYTKKVDNPFYWLDDTTSMNLTRKGITKERREKLYNYFVSQIEKVKNGET